MNVDRRKFDIFEWFLKDPATCNGKNCTTKRLAILPDDATKHSDRRPYNKTKEESPPVRQKILYKNNYSIKPKKSGKENHIHEAYLKSIKDSIQDIFSPRQPNVTDELEKTLYPDTTSQRAELQKQDQILPKEPSAGTSVIQKTDKHLAYYSYSEKTMVNDIATHTTEVKVNKLQVPDVNALTYELEYFPQNAMIIFNHEHFFDNESTRTGTDRDVNALIDTFKRFRFDVTTYNDLKRKPLLEKLQRFGKQNFEDCGCICVAVLTNGSDHGFLRAADVRYSERELFACFDTQTNPSLVAKPIIFLIQACRGDQLASSVLVYQSTPPRLVELDGENNKQSGYFLPTEADMIIFHSCFFGRASARVVGEGTWFIQTICEQLNLYASTEHLEDIFRRVRKIIALEKGFEHAKQMPVMSSTLLRKLYLVPKRGFGAECCVNPANNIIETRSAFDANLDSTRNKLLYVFTEHAFLGVAVTIVYCCLLHSSIVREHIFFFPALVFAYMGRFGVSWSKMLASLVLFFIFLKITGHNISWEIVKLLR